MIGPVLALLAASITSPQAAHLGSGNPFEADKLLLLQASRACHVHDGAVYFIQHSRLEAPAIHTTAALGDTEAQLTCVLQSLPSEFMARYRVDVEVPPQPPKARHAARGHRSRSLRR